MPVWRMCNSKMQTIPLLEDGDTGYLGFSGSILYASSESDAQATLRDAYTWSDLLVRIAASDTGAASDITLMQNGGASALTVSVGAAQTGDFEDLVNEVDFVDGDTISVEYASGGGHGTLFAPILTAFTVENTGVIELDTMWLGNASGGCTFYLTSGQFTSTIKTSLFHNPGTFQDGFNMLNAAKDLGQFNGTSDARVMSGRFTNTVKDSQDFSSINTGMLGLGFDGTDTPISGTTTDDFLYLMSGQFSLTVKRSVDVSGIDNDPQGISWDGTNTPWVGDEADKLYLQSGHVLSTLKTSQDVSAFDGGPVSISFSQLTGDTPWQGNAVGKLFLTSGQFSSTMHDSVSTVGVAEFAGWGMDVDDRLSAAPLAASGKNPIQAFQADTDWNEDTIGYTAIGGPFQSDAEGNVNYILGGPFLFEQLEVNVISNDTDNASTITLRDTGAGTSLVVSIGAGTTGLLSDLVNTASLDDPDQISYQVDVGVGKTGDEIIITNINMNMTSDADDRHLSVHSRLSGQDIGDSVTAFAAIEGNGYTTGESNTAIDIKNTIDTENYSTLITANTLDEATDLFLRLDGANTALGVSVPAAATGSFQNQADTVSFVDGEEINHIIDTTASTSGVIRVFTLGFDQLTPAAPPVGGRRVMVVT